MMGTIYILLDGVFLLLLFAYLTRNTEAGKGFWSKAYHMLLLGWLKVDIAMAQGMEYVRISLAHILRAIITAPEVPRISAGRRSISGNSVRIIRAARSIIGKEKNLTGRFLNKYGGGDNPDLQYNKERAASRGYHPGALLFSLSLIHFSDRRYSFRQICYPRAKQ